jgi:hypothetical protein
MKNTESEAIQRAGASPHLPLDTLSRARGPPTRHSARLTRARGPPTRRTTPRSRLIPRIAAKVARRGALSPGEPNQAARSPPRFESSHRFSPAPSHRHQVRRTKKSPAPSSDDVPHRGSSAMLSTPPRSAASQVRIGCRCHKRRPSTMSRTALENAKQPWLVLIRMSLPYSSCVTTADLIVLLAAHEHNTL